MREILFRGKRTDKGTWIEGNLIHCVLMDGRNYTCILEADDSDSSPWEFPYLCCETGCIDGYARPVNPETVGQFTGLTDKKGKRIFEGDIVRHHNDNPDSEIEEKGVVFWDEKYCGWRRTSNGAFHHGVVDTYRLSPDCLYENIGNIHDNPELLEVSGDE